jgi:hypothetical protein
MRNDREGDILYVRYYHNSTNFKVGDMCVTLYNVLHYYEHSNTVVWVFGRG